jgi:hypothetical protein
MVCRCDRGYFAQCWRARQSPIGSRFKEVPLIYVEMFLTMAVLKQCSHWACTVRLTIALKKSSLPD